MDIATEVAKCREAAARLTDPRDFPGFAERIATELLAARADALREMGTPYRAEHGPGPAYRAFEELDREVRSRRARGL